MRVRVEEQEEDARVATDSDGMSVLILKPGLVGPRAFVALVLSLEPLQHGRQVLQDAG